MSGFNLSSGAGLGTAVLGSRYMATHTRGPVGAAARTMMAATGFAFTLYVVLALGLIVAGIVLRKASKSTEAEV